MSGPVPVNLTLKALWMESCPARSAACPALKHSPRVGTALSGVPHSLPCSLRCLFLHAGNWEDTPLAALEGLTGLQHLDIAYQNVKYQIQGSLVLLLGLPSLNLPSPWSPARCSPCSSWQRPWSTCAPTGCNWT